VVLWNAVHALLLGGNFFNSGDIDAGSETVTFIGSSNYQIAVTFPAQTSSTNRIQRQRCPGSQRYISVNANLRLPGIGYRCLGKTFGDDSLLSGIPGCLTLSRCFNVSATFIDHGYKRNRYSHVVRYMPMISDGIAFLHR
jgi:hypothetical protein